MGADAGGQAVDDNLEDAADGVAGTKHGIDLGLHLRLVLRVDAVQQNLVLLREGDDLVPVRGAGELGLTYADDVGQHLDAEDAEQQLGESAGGDTSRRLAGAGAFENVASLLEVVLQRTGEVGMTGTW